MPPSDRVSIASSLAVAGATAYGALRVLGPREVLPTPPAVRVGDFFSEAEIAAGRRFRRPQSALGFARTALELGVLSGLVARQVRRRRRDEDLDDPVELSTSPSPRVLGPALAAAGTAAGLSVATTALTLPLSALSRRRSLRAGLATDSWSSWGRDLALSTAIEAGMSAVLLGGSSALAARTGVRWWRYASGATVGVGVIAGVLGPVLLDPIFNDFTPLPEGDSRADVMALAAAAGVTVGEVFSVDASRRTTAVNAYVNGLGPTKRVVLFDTLLRDYSRDEVRFVVAHELGHVAHRDIYRQVLFLTLCAPASLRAAQQLARVWAGELTGAASVPALSLATWAVGAPLILSGAALSRAVERRTDHFGLGLSDAPEALISFFRRIAVQNLADVTPGRRISGLFATHPPITERIGAALAYQAGTTGPRTPAGS